MMRNTIAILCRVFLFSMTSAALHAQTIEDIDGNIYNTVTIGKQVWMAENLKTTKFRDGTQLSFVRDNKDLNAIFLPAYFWYNNDEISYKDPYGALYNWYAVKTNKLCPAGWHIPGFKEWKKLVAGLGGGERVAGGKLKEAGTVHWTSPNKNATNSSGFIALPGGFRDSNGIFRDAGKYCGWWSSAETSEAKAYYRGVLNYNSSLGSGAGLKRDGFSVRCLRDN